VDASAKSSVLAEFATMDSFAGPSQEIPLLVEDTTAQENSNDAPSVKPELPDHIEL
jgi:hypothetical protein